VQIDKNDLSLDTLKFYQEVIPMPWYFIAATVLCLVTLFSWHKSKQNQDDFCYLSACISLVSFMFCLILAPMALKCLLLLAVLLINIPNEPKPEIINQNNQIILEPTQELKHQEADQKVKLIYRGATYEKSHIVASPIEQLHHEEEKIVKKMIVRGSTYEVDINAKMTQNLAYSSNRK
jgi:hypothetical protein